MISAEQQAWLDNVTATDLTKLFVGGLTRSGHGIGLSSCVDFVAASFGVPTPDEALKRGYLRTKIIKRHYYAWFHWPVYQPDPHGREVICDCGD